MRRNIESCKKALEYFRSGSDGIGMRDSARACAIFALEEVIKNTAEKERSEQGKKSDSKLLKDEIDKKKSVNEFLKQINQTDISELNKWINALKISANEKIINMLKYELKKIDDAAGKAVVLCSERNCEDCGNGEAGGDQRAKEDSGKLRLELVPREIIRNIAAVREYGTRKYKDPENWRRVEEERFRNAAFRHFLAFLDEPEGADEESGLPHLWHLACNIAFLCEKEKERGTWTGKGSGQEAKAAESGGD